MRSESEGRKQFGVSGLDGAGAALCLKLCDKQGCVQPEHGVAAAVVLIEEIYDLTHPQCRVDMEHAWPVRTRTRFSRKTGFRLESL